MASHGALATPVFFYTFATVLTGAREHIVIRGCGSISPIGHTSAGVAQAYLHGQAGFSSIPHQGQTTPVAALSAAAEQALAVLAAENPVYRQLDRSVLLAIFSAKEAVRQADWEQNSSQPGLAVNIGSSRGATGLTERHYEDFLQNTLSSSASPTTTLGNLSSWVAQAVQAGGMQLSHSITCSTALMAVANAVAWLRAGMAQRFLAGGTEAPLTDFTIAQMKAIGIYSSLHNYPYPCQPYGTSAQNTFVLGEGAAVLALEKVQASNLKPGDVVVESVGFGFEPITSKTGISTTGHAFQQAMRQALTGMETQHVDAIITHTPGTKAGDKAELAAVQAVFKENKPLLTTNKHLIGHTLGASGALSLEYALHLLRHQRISTFSYPTSYTSSAAIPKLHRVMVNAAGFGGNAASVVLASVS